MPNKDKHTRPVGSCTPQPFHSTRQKEKVKAKLMVCMQAIKDIMGNTIPESTIKKVAMKYSADVQKTLNAILPNLQGSKRRRKPNNKHKKLQVKASVEENTDKQKRIRKEIEDLNFNSKIYQPKIIPKRSKQIFQNRKSSSSLSAPKIVQDVTLIHESSSSVPLSTPAITPTSSAEILSYTVLNSQKKQVIVVINSDVLKDPSVSAGPVQPVSGEEEDNKKSIAEPSEAEISGGLYSFVCRNLEGSSQTKETEKTTDEPAVEITSEESVPKELEVPNKSHEEIIILEEDFKIIKTVTVINVEDYDENVFEDFLLPQSENQSMMNKDDESCSEDGSSTLSKETLELLNFENLKEIPEFETLSPFEKRITSWTVEEVIQFVEDVTKCSTYSDKFREEDIDGQALIMLNDKHLTNSMSMKLGPAVKLAAAITKIKNELELT